MTAFDPAPLCDRERDAVLFPVRHHSPAAARLVVTLIDELKPTAVLIEGPADFNDRLAELFLPHRPPIAIYSFALLADYAGGPGSRTGAYYPFCDHSPEWQAARHAHAAGIPVRFIDLPWADMVTGRDDAPTNRYADVQLTRSRYGELVCRELGVDTFDDAWDTLFEIDPDLGLDEYMVRCHTMCAHMRLADGVPPPGDERREAFMAEHIRAALAEFGGRVLVVTGGYHSLGLHELLAKPAPEKTPPADGPKVLDRGIALTPYSFDRLDSLKGYNSGMPNPGFYHRVWHARRGDRWPLHQELLRRVAADLRDKNQPVSAADLIAAETTASALALMRGHPRVWRTDLLDGLTAALIKDDFVAGMRHPILEAVREVMRGGERGELAAGTALPPLVRDIQNELNKHALVANRTSRDITLKLADPKGRDASRVLHRVRVLQVAGYTLTRSATDDPTAAEITETWKVVWSPEFDGACIEACRYGATLQEAAAARLLEEAAAVQRDAGLAARLLLDAALAGLQPLADDLLATVRRLIAGDADFFAVAGALDKLLFLFRYDPVLGTAGRADIGDLVREAFDRSLYLFESLGSVSGKDKETLDAVRAVVDTFERCEKDLQLSRPDFLAALRRVTADAGQGTVSRGAALGALWVLGDADGAFVTRQLRGFADPEKLGDFLTGVFALAREQVRRQKPFLAAINDLIAGYTLDQFLLALPPLRLAFTFFPPREKHHLALTLREALGLVDVPDFAPLTVDPNAAAAAFAFEERLFAAAKRYGLRTGEVSA